MKIDKYHILLTVLFIITITLFFTLTSMKDDQLREKDSNLTQLKQRVYNLQNQMSNITTRNNINEAVIWTYQDAICAYENPASTQTQWYGSIDSLEIRNVTNESTDKIIAWVLGCYNSSDLLPKDEKIALVFRFPPYNSDIAIEDSTNEKILDHTTTG